LVKAKRGQNNSEAVKKCIVNGMLEKKAENITVIDLRNLFNPIADFLVLGTANSDKHGDAIAEEIEKMVLKDQKERVWFSEGRDLNEWIILDFVNVIAHVFLEKKREFFALEELWGDGRQIQIEPRPEKAISG
jgi:ribosome-associated protein